MSQIINQKVIIADINRKTLTIEKTCKRKKASGLRKPKQPLKPLASRICLKPIANLTKSDCAYDLWIGKR